MTFKINIRLPSLSAVETTTSKVVPSITTVVMSSFNVLSYASTPRIFKAFISNLQFYTVMITDN